jgi:hypothetical protein
MNLSNKTIVNRNKSAEVHTSNILAEDQITASHKFTINTQLAFKKMINKLTVAKKSKTILINNLSIARSIYRGRLVCRKAGCFHVTVSEPLVNRAISLLDTLAIGLEKRKFKIQFIQKNESAFVVAIKDREEISFHVSEGYKYRPIKNEHRSEFERMLFRDNEPIPTSQLTLSILARETGISKNWSDGNRQIEDHLPAIINSFENLVFRQKERRIYNVMIADQRVVETKSFLESESSKYAEKAIYDKAMQEAKLFITHRDLESYLNHLEEKSINDHGHLNEATRSWLWTVMKLAEMQNPVSTRLKILGDSNK